MTGVVLVTASVALEDRVRYAAGGAVVAVPARPLPTDPGQILGLFNGSGPPDVVVLDPGVDDIAPALTLAARFDQQHPDVSVVLVTDQAADVGLAAMRAGVRDLMHPAADVEDIRWVLHRAGQAARERGQALGLAEPPSRSAGQVITVASPKGGVGKTTLSTNLAVGLAEVGSTVLVDLDVQFGDVASALDIDPEFTLTDVVAEAPSQDTMVLKTLLTQHRTGFYVVCGPASPVEADAISNGQVSNLLTQLKNEFRYVVIDTAPGLTEYTLSALDETTDLLLVTSMDVPGVRGLRKELEVLDELDIVAGTRHVVMNFADSRRGLTVADVESTIRTKVDVTLPRSDAVTLSTNQGIPLLEEGSRDKLTKELYNLVSRFTPVPIKPGRRSGRHRAGVR